MKNENVDKRSFRLYNFQIKRMEKNIPHNEINSDNNVKPLCNLYDCNIAFFFNGKGT